MDILIPNKTDPLRYEKVKTLMKTIGAPVIDCFKINNIFYALEGSHRISAAKELGILPILNVIAEIDEDYDDLYFQISNGFKIRMGKGLLIKFYT